MWIQVAIRNIRREAVDAVKKAEKAKSLGKDQVPYRGTSGYFTIHLFESPPPSSTFVVIPELVVLSRGVSVVS